MTLPLYSATPLPRANFVFTGYVPTGWTFTRASNGQYLNQSGILTTATTNEARFEYDGSGVAKGLLLENDATNLILQSTDFANASWTKTGGAVTNPAVTNITGAANTNLFTEDTSTGVHSLFQAITKAASAIFYNQSIYIKPNGRTRVLFRIESNAGVNGVGADITLTGNGTLNSVTAFGTGWSAQAAYVERLQNGWYRIHVAGLSNTATSATYVLYGLNASGSSSYTGDGTSGFYIYGAQLEANTERQTTSHIATTTTTASRSRDVCTATPSWFVNGSNGSLYAEVYTNVFAPNTTLFFFQVDDGTNNNRYALRHAAAGIGFTMVTAGVADFLAAPSGTTVGSINRIATSWAANDAYAVVNLTNTAADTSGALNAASMTTARLSSQANLSRINGNLRRLLYWPYKIPNADLIGFAP